jgi:hypothetical protein
MYFQTSQVTLLSQLLLFIYSSVAVTFDRTESVFVWFLYHISPSKRHMHNKKCVTVQISGNMTVYVSDKEKSLDQNVVSEDGIKF